MTGKAFIFCMMISGAITIGINTLPEMLKKEPIPEIAIVTEEPTVIEFDTSMVRDMWFQEANYLTSPPDISGWDTDIYKPTEVTTLKKYLLLTISNNSVNSATMDIEVIDSINQIPAK